MDYAEEPISLVQQEGFVGSATMVQWDSAGHILHPGSSPSRLDSVLSLDPERPRRESEADDITLCNSSSL